MKKLKLLSMCACAFVFAACGGGQQASVPQGAAPDVAPSGYVVPHFTIVVPNAQIQSLGSGPVKFPQYVSASTLSVNITLNTVNGGAPPGGLTTSVTTNVSSGSCNSGCTVGGPAVPPGTDNFTVTTYSSANAGGSQLSTQTQSYVITAGQTNALSITLDGIPKSFTISGVPTANAGTAFGSPSALTLTVKDAGGNTITGTYANAVTLSDSDTSGLSNASSLILNSGSAASSVQTTASSDVIKLNYGGQAIAQATLTASATGATSGTAHFTPTLSSILPSPTEVDLYATSGTGSSGTVTVSELGWSNTPYDQNFTVSVPAGCANIATISPSSGTSFTVSAVGSPSVGTCTATFSDGAGQSAGVTLTYTTVNLNLSASRRRFPNN